MPRIFLCKCSKGFRKIASGMRCNDAVRTYDFYQKQIYRDNTNKYLLVYQSAGAQTVKLRSCSSNVAV